MPPTSASAPVLGSALYAVLNNLTAAAAISAAGLLEYYRLFEFSLPPLPPHLTPPSPPPNETTHAKRQFCIKYFMQIYSYVVPIHVCMLRMANRTTTTTKQLPPANNTK